MTLILTQISTLGIVHAADSNLTLRSGLAGGNGKKVFKIPYLKAGLSVAGSYSVGGVRMDSWMPHAIAKYAATASLSLNGFAECLRGRLEAEMMDSEKHCACLVHIAGYASDSTGIHPELYYVRNIVGMDPATGSYTGLKKTFDASEDFWNRDFQDASHRALFATGRFSQIYVNGYPEGRIVYLELWHRFEALLNDAWNVSGWHFRPPNTIREEAEFVKVKFDAIATMFRVSNFTAPPIGGPVQMLKIPAP